MSRRLDKPNPDEIGRPVFDENFMPKEIGFCSGMIFGSSGKATQYIGVMLPSRQVKKQHIKGKKETEYYAHEEAPFLAINNPKDNSLCSLSELATLYGLKLQFKVEPVKSTFLLGWSMKGLESFHNNVKPEFPTASDIFSAIRQEYEKSIFFTDDRFYTIQPLWDMATYFYDLFEAFPYINMVGLKGTGKSKVGRQSRLFAFNSTPLMTSMSEASIFRIVHAYSPTLYIDEAENLVVYQKGRMVHSDIVSLLNSGAYKGGVTPRMEKVKDKYEVMNYNSYCPKMLMSINGLKSIPAMESRSITNTMTAAGKDKRMNSVVPEKPNLRHQKIRDSLHELRLSKGSTVYDLTNTGFTTNGPIKTGELHGRERDKWLPLLCVAKLISDDVYSEVLKYAEELQQTQGVDSVEPDHWHMEVLKVVWNSIEQRLFEHLPSGISEEIKASRGESKDYVPKSERIGRFLNNVGFAQYKTRRKSGAVYCIDEKSFRNVCSNQDIIFDYGEQIKEENLKNA